MLLTITFQINQFGSDGGEAGTDHYIKREKGFLSYGIITQKKKNSVEDKSVHFYKNCHHALVISQQTLTHTQSK